jgi:sarcosine oxidase
LDGREVQKRWPVFNLDEGWEAVYSPNTGMLLTEPALRSFIRVATRGGVQIHEHEPVQSWQADGDGVQVETHHKTYSTGRLIITAGPWSGKVLASLGLPLKVSRKLIWWLGIQEPDRFAPGALPIFNTQTDFGGIYGFPVHEIVGLRIANGSAGTPADADSIDRTVYPHEVSQVLPFAQRYLRYVSGEVVASGVCMYTMTPDGDFIIDRHPEHPQVVFAAGFSGHGFKFAPLVGEMLASLALDPRAGALQRFALSRFATPARDRE